MLSPFKRMLRETGRLDDLHQLPEGEERFCEHPLWQVAAKRLDFCLRKKRRAKRARRINLGEVRSYLDAEETAGHNRRNVGDVRVPILADSQISLGAIAKGRSSSPGIPKASLGVIPLVPTSGHLQLMLLCGACQASVELPQSWVASCHGDHSELDAFLRDCGLHPEQLDIKVKRLGTRAFVQRS